MASLAFAGRRHARERALELMYEAEMKSISPDAVLDLQSIVPDDYTVQIMHGIEEHQDWIDTQISTYSYKWDIERLAVVDKQLLRIALYEIYFADEIPTAVAIDEAIELAKQFSTEDSPKYINGILGNIVNEKDDEKDNSGDL